MKHDAFLETARQCDLLTIESLVVLIDSDIGSHLNGSS